MDSVNIKLKVGGVEIPSHPVFGDDVKVKVSRADNQIFNRVKIDGKIKLVGSDFDFVASCSNETTLTLAFYRGSSLIGEGTFIKADCELNYADKVCEVKLTTTDRYEKILGNYDNKYNLVDLAPVIHALTMYRRPVLQFYMMGDTKITNYIGNTAFEEDASGEAEGMIESDILSAAFTKLYHRLIIEISDLSADVNGSYSGNYVGDNTILWNDAGTYYLKCVYATSQGGAYFRWTIHSSDGTTWNWGGSSMTYIQYMYSQASQYTAVPRSTEKSFTCSFSGGSTQRGSVYFNNREIFCRMIHNYGSSISGQTTVTLANLSEDVAERNYNFLYGSTVAGWGIDLDVFSSMKVQDAPTKYGVNADGKYFVPPDCLGQNDVMIPIAWNMWSPMSWWFEGGPWVYQYINTYYKKYTLPDAYPIWSCIQRLLNEIDPNISYDPNSSKHIFFGDSRPCGYLPTPASRGMQLYLTPITNVKKTFYEQAARRGDITLKQIFDMLRGVFQVYWWIDDDNQLRMENIEYFKHNQSYAQGIPNADIDVTAMKDMPNGLSWAFGQETASFERKDCPSRYEFEWGDECTEQFQGYAIDVDDAHVSQDKKEKINISGFLSDVDYVTIRPSEVSDDLWMLLEAEISGGGQSPHAVPWCEIALDENSPQYSLFNGYLSFMFTAKYFYRYNLGGWKAKLGGVDMVVKSTTQYVKQSVNHPILRSQIGSIGAVKTNLGVGLLTEQEINLDTLFAKSKIVMEGERDLSKYVQVTSYGTHTVTVYVQNNYWDTIVFRYATVSSVGNYVTIQDLIVPAGAERTFGYVPSVQSWRRLSVSKLSSFLEFGEPTFECSDSAIMTANMASHSAGYAEIEFDGNGGGASEWGYICLKCEKRTRINLSANCGTSLTFGYVGSQPCTDFIDSAETIHVHASGTDYVQYIANAGEVVYLGYCKATNGNEDKVTFEIEVPE